MNLVYFSLSQYAIRVSSFHKVLGPISLPYCRHHYSLATFANAATTTGSHCSSLSSCLGTIKATDHLSNRPPSLGHRPLSKPLLRMGCHPSPSLSPRIDHQPLSMLPPIIDHHPQNGLPTHFQGHHPKSAGTPSLGHPSNGLAHSL